MKYRTLGAAILALLIGVSPNFGQQAADNPFPDVIARSVALRPFDLQAPKLKLSGVITQPPTHILPQNPYQYFRMSVSGQNGTEIWAVLLRAADSEVANLKPGVTVTVLGTPTKDGTKRVELVQSSGPNSAGLMNLIVNAQ